MDWISLFVGSGITLVTAWLAVRWTQRASKQERHGEVEFSIYMHLLVWKGLQWWSASAEVSGKECSPATLAKREDVAWIVADKVRSADAMPDAEDILRLLFSMKFADEKTRAARADEVVKALGARINPQYNDAMEQITKENESLLESDVVAYMDRLHKARGL